jgi:Cu+-exporting ATPase
MVDGRTILVGSRRLLADWSIRADEVDAPLRDLEAGGQTALLVAVDGRLSGIIAVADTIKEGSAEAVRALQDLGLMVWLITGDNAGTAAAIGRAAGIGKVMAEARPEQKATAIARMQGNRQVVAMVGDGINDAPALAKADVGIAIGTGTDVAMATADITLVRGDLRSLPVAIALSRATMHVIRQNLFWAFIYNIILIPLAAFGVVTPIMAAAAMALSSVTVVSNSLRLNRFGRSAHLVAQDKPNPMTEQYLWKP